MSSQEARRGTAYRAAIFSDGTYRWIELVSVDLTDEEIAKSRVDFVEFLDAFLVSSWDGAAAPYDS